MNKLLTFDFTTIQNRCCRVVAEFDDDNSFTYELLDRVLKERTGCFREDQIKIESEIEGRVDFSANPDCGSCMEHARIEITKIRDLTIQGGFRVTPLEEIHLKENDSLPEQQLRPEVH